MKISTTIISLRSTVNQWKAEGLRIGFVPTMGHLHAGHISLVEKARASCDRVVVSIFVNPLQFNEASDFSAYPKTLESDQQKLTEANADLLFLPDTELMYPAGQDTVSKVSVPEIGDELEGACRPGHFDGVATVVLKLFNLVQPQAAFFGEKDFQQLLLVKKMVIDLDLPIEVTPVPTCREADGLAMSSRNSRLTKDQRAIAAKLYETLQQLSRKLQNNAETVQVLESKAIKALRQSGLEPEYISVRDCSNLQPATPQSNCRIVLGAARLGEVRLIDNLVVN